MLTVVHRIEIVNRQNEIAMTAIAHQKNQPNSDRLAMSKKRDQKVACDSVDKY